MLIDIHQKHLLYCLQSKQISFEILMYGEEVNWLKQKGLLTSTKGHMV
jgi:hypothetical protein